LAAAVEAGARVIVVPKSESAAAIAEVARRIDGLERACGRAAGSVRIIALVETARGIARAAGLIEAPARAVAFAFGHADFALDMGLAEADASAGVVFHARSALAIAAKAAGVAPLDCVYLAVKDDAGFREDAALGLRLGFEGKLCIHPAQVLLANEVYTPTPGEIEHARRVVEAWERAAAEGRGVFALDGKMIDAPVVRRQQRVLARARTRG
jgi:citrate lyase subunit beta/citryl-CoA lyase